MGFFNFIKKKLVSAKESGKVINQEYNNTIKKAYINTLERYTSMHVTVEDIDENVSKKLAGLFNNKFDCSLFCLRKDIYAIRFNDNMLPEEFNQVFDLIRNDFGEPDMFSEYDGYVWNQEDHIITFGLVGLNYNYDVPMICLREKITKFSSTVKYKDYTIIADAINKPLIDRGINVQKKDFYPIAYTKQFAYSTLVDLPKSLICINYEGGKLEMSIVPVIQEGAYRVVKSQNQLRKHVLVRDISMIEEKLNELLEETKDYYEIN